MAYIAFAREQKKYFKLLFVDKFPEAKSMFDVVNGSAENVVKQINKARALGCVELADMFMRMWIFIHGSACMMLAGDYDLNDEETVILLERSYNAFSRL